ncbi:granzyme A-like [Pelobates fuscus]|uniref:granzyme A-like n=1 Tax=Pelobates fuscus TaxID=191477 RepID=UPI002FE45132
MGFFYICYTSALFLFIAFSKGDSTEIIGGKKAKAHSRPYMAFFTGSDNCGGTLIKTNWVLTAAHCKVDDKSVVILGANYWKQYEREQQRFSVSKILKYPGFQSRTLSNDFQLIQLDRHAKLGPFVSVFPFPKSTDDMKENTQCNTAGWGYTVPNVPPNVPQLSRYLRETNLTIIDRASCRSEYRKQNIKALITENMLCAKPVEDRRDDACMGDSGGPLICENQLRGIVSYGDSTCSSKVPTVYTRLTSKYVKWIEAKIAAF